MDEPPPRRAAEAVAERRGAQARSAGLAVPSLVHPALRSEPHTKLQAKRRVAQGYDALVATPGELQWQFEEVVRAIIGAVAGNRTHPQRWD